MDSLDSSQHEESRFTTHTNAIRRSMISDDQQFIRVSLREQSSHALDNHRSSDCVPVDADCKELNITDSITKLTTVEDVKELEIELTTLQSAVDRCMSISLLIPILILCSSLAKQMATEFVNRNGLPVLNQLLDKTESLDLQELLIQTFATLSLLICSSLGFDGWYRFLGTDYPQSVL